MCIFLAFVLEHICRIFHKVRWESRQGRRQEEEDQQLVNNKFLAVIAEHFLLMLDSRRHNRGTLHKRPFDTYINRRPHTEQFHFPGMFMLE